MKIYYILAVLLLSSYGLQAQPWCPNLEGAAPAVKHYKKYTMTQKGCDGKGMYVANFIYGKFDNEQMMSFVLIDGNVDESRVDEVKVNAAAIKQLNRPAGVTDE